MIDLLFYFKEKSVSKAPPLSWERVLGGEVINKKEANLPASLIYPYTSKLSHSR